MYYENEGSEKMRKTIFCLVLTIISSSVVIAQGTEFMTWDTNMDGTISKFEFRNEFMKEYFADWDMNDDKYLDDEDFYRTTYLILDDDNDNLLSIDKWTFGYEHFYHDYITNDFVLYDLDKDNFLTYDEFRPVLMDTDYYVAYDIDENSYISEYELATKVFQTWDFDDSGTLSKSEFETF